MENWVYPSIHVLFSKCIPFFWGNLLAPPLLLHPCCCSPSINFVLFCFLYYRKQAWAWVLSLAHLILGTISFTSYTNQTLMHVLKFRFLLCKINCIIPNNNSPSLALESMSQDSILFILLFQILQHMYIIFTMWPIP